MRSLRFGTLLAPNLRGVYEAVVEHLARSTGVEIRLQDRVSYEEFFEGRVDGGFICGLPYVLMADGEKSKVELLGAPVLTGPRYEDRPIYFSDVIVHRDSPYQGFEDLRGATWAFNEPLSHSGAGVVRYHLASLGENGGFFSKIHAAGYHRRSIRMVADGQVDASAIDSQVLDLELLEDPSLAERLRVIETIGPSTIQPVVVNAAVGRDLRDAMRAALAELHLDPRHRPTLERGLIERFQSIDDDAYNDIRRMRRIAEDAGVDEMA